MPARQAQLHTWLSEACGLSDFTLSNVAGDASFRRYFRVERAGQPSLIAMDAPPEKENSAPFLDVSNRLAATGVHVPAVQASDLTQGFILLEDLGDALYQPALTAQHVDQLYGDAIAALLQFQQAGDSTGLPEYDRTLLRNEIGLFPEWLLARHLNIALSVEQHAALEQVFELLVESALAQPQVLVHRDYHSRNLLKLADRNPGIIDYQDAVLGPISYDLVSLLRDCYIRWEPEQVAQWRDAYVAEALEKGLLNAEQAEQFPRWFDLMGAQRHLKAAGIFARLWHRDGKPGYLADVPRTLGYIVDLGEAYPELSPLVALIKQQVLPQLAEQ